MKIIVIIVMMISNSCIKNVNTLSMMNKDINDDLIIAVIKGDKDKVIASLNKGANVNHKNKLECTALIYASKSGNIDVVRLLLEKGADVNDKNRVEYTALMYASRNGDEDIVKLLLEKDAYVNDKSIYGDTALTLVVNKIKEMKKEKRNDYISIAHMLIKKMKDDYIKLFISVNKDENTQQWVKDEIKNYINLFHNLNNLPLELFVNIISFINKK